MPALWQDFRYGLRTLAQRPGFTLAAVLVIGLGIGANTTIFSVVDTVLLRPLPYDQPEQLLRLWTIDAAERANPYGSSPPDFRAWRERNRVFEGIVAYYSFNFNLTANEQPERLAGQRVSPGLFQLLGVEPLLGRAFLPDEEVYGNHRVVILSHALWQGKFQGDPAIVGRSLTLNDQPFTVVGVMPRDFEFPSAQVRLWAPMAFGSGDDWNTRSNYFLDVVGRLKPGVTMAQAQAEMDIIARRLTQEFKENAGRGVFLAPLQEVLVKDVQTGLLLLLGAVGCVLLIVCANIGNMLLARAVERQREMAVRASLGANGVRLLRQLLTESVTLALLGGALGVVLSIWGIDLVVALSPEGMPRIGQVAIDPQVLGFALFVSLLTGVVFGLAPALMASRLGLTNVLRQAGAAGGALQGNRLRSALVVAEVALSLVLLTGAGLLTRSLLGLQRVHPGFNPEGVLTLSLPVPENKYPNTQASAAFFQQVLERVESLPGVRSAGLTTLLPFSGGGWVKYLSLADRPPATRLEDVKAAHYRLVSPDYFRAMGSRLIEGRVFTEQDGRDTQPVAIVNETLARQNWRDKSPLGVRLWTGPPEELFRSELPPGFSFPRREIVGVVEDVHYQGLNEPPPPVVYAPYVQNTDATVSMSLVVRTDSDPLQHLAAVRQRIWEIDPNQPVSDPQTLSHVVFRSLTQPRFLVILLGSFAAVALLLAALGIYGVTAYSVSRRRQEIGIRMALGAQRGDVLGGVLRQGARLTLIGVGVGLAGSLALSRLIASQLYHVAPTDPLTLAGVALVLIVAALLACYLPARRAAKVDPMQALRYE